ncbi:hypothetical protein CI238_12526 [Colletotrichum incanum]|uniref:Uncharacterized protein n=1 Tax=Colletotrichum incanum TaxID=1573173 RepID=A0A161WFH3_COLIC|nr:hypothetical protein CI238_12526 [Colletotrichum incanum]
MKGSHATVSAFLSTAISLIQANSDIVSLHTNGVAYIQEASATVVLPELPSPLSGDVAIWSAIMMNNQASFLQGVTSSSPSGTDSFFVAAGSDPTVGEPVEASPGSTVKTHYKLNKGTRLWDQNVYVDGKLVSSVSTSKGQTGEIFYISIECASGNCPDHPAHSWTNVSIVLSNADESFKHAGSWAHGASGGAVSSPDGGRTWNFDTINVPAQKAE